MVQGIIRRAIMPPTPLALMCRIQPESHCRQTTARLISTKQVAVLMAIGMKFFELAESIAL